MTALGLSVSELEIEAGDTVRWTNDHSDDHQVLAGDGSFDSGTIVQGGSFSHTFDGEGVWTYSDPLTLLESFSGTITVRGDSGRAMPDVFNINAEVYGSDTFDFVKKESSIWHPRLQAFFEIVDGDLDNDSLPNFIDPDNDNDGFPDSSDTDDDNDGLLDMYDVDDDNDGIFDRLTEDTNGDGILDSGDGLPIGIPGIDCELDYDRDADDDIYRAIDSDYDLVWDWKDTDLGAAFPADNLLGNPGVDPNDLPYDLDNDGKLDLNDAFPEDFREDLHKPFITPTY